MQQEHEISTLKTHTPNARIIQNFEMIGVDALEGLATEASLWAKRISLAQ